MTMSLARLSQIGPEKGGAFEVLWDCPFLRAHLLSDIGNKREHNEDSCMLSVPENPALTASQGLLFAVADGMGGASAGECASRWTLDTLAERVFAEGNGTIPVRLTEAIGAANQRIFEYASSNPDDFYGMGTTASALVILGNHAYVIQVGDSRVYVVRNGGPLYQVTRDHSIVAEQVRHGIITEEQARQHPHKNIITRAIGIKDTVEADLFAFRLKRGDTILICSDGLSNMVGDPEIGQTLRLDQLPAATHRLISRALAEGGSDNITAVVIRITGTPPKSHLEQDINEVAIPSPGLLYGLRRLVGF